MERFTPRPAQLSIRLSTARQPSCPAPAPLAPSPPLPSHAAGVGAAGVVVGGVGAIFGGVGDRSGWGGSGQAAAALEPFCPGDAAGGCRATGEEGDAPAPPCSGVSG